MWGRGRDHEGLLSASFRLERCLTLAAMLCDFALLSWSVGDADWRCPEKGLPDPQEKDRVIYEKSQQEEGRDRDLGWEEQYQDVGKSVQRLQEHWLGVAQYFYTFLRISKSYFQKHRVLHIQCCKEKKEMSTIYNFSALKSPKIFFKWIISKINELDPYLCCHG